MYEKLCVLFLQLDSFHVFSFLWGSFMPVNRVPAIAFTQNRLFVGTHSLSSVFCSRIHITEDVRQHIGSDYEVEDGHGQARDKYLADNGIKTYFVIADPKRDKHVSS